MTEFEELVDAHYQPLYRFGFSLAKDPDRAADLVQQTFCIWVVKSQVFALLRSFSWCPFSAQIQNVCWTRSAARSGSFAKENPNR